MKEEHVEPPEEHGIHREEVAGQESDRLGTEELTPGRTRSCRRRLYVVTLQDGPNGRGRQSDAHAKQLAVDPPIAPGGVLLREADHQPNGAGWERRSPGAMGICPTPSHQVPVPAHQSVGLDEEPPALGPGQQAAQPREQGPISRSKRRPGDLSAKDCNFVAKDDDFDCQIRGVSAPQSKEVEHPEEGDIEKGHGHRPPSLARRRSRNSPAQGIRTTFSAPHSLSAGNRGSRLPAHGATVRVNACVVLPRTIVALSVNG